ncbi:MAG: PTS sugar transporter subunit IIB [Candidatus Adiutrix sp.]|jgi:PTS system mannose-specific IIB component|nr:PTS sugar transporter subunit IIB [Candidatus Adiutrix sp.]
MTLVWARVDQKLIHGQVSVAWTPHLNVDSIVVSDHNAAEDARLQKIMLLGLPPEIKSAAFVEPDGLTAALEAADNAGRRVLLLFKDLDGVMAAIEAGLSLNRLNLGNQAYPPHSPAVTQLADTFFASRSDLDGLAQLTAAGTELILQSLPTSKAVRWTAAGLK